MASVTASGSIGAVGCGSSMAPRLRDPRHGGRAHRRAKDGAVPGPSRIGGARAPTDQRNPFPPVTGSTAPVTYVASSEAR